MNELLRDCGTYPATSIYVFGKLNAHLDALVPLDSDYNDIVQRVENFNIGRFSYRSKKLCTLRFYDVENHIFVILKRTYDTVLARKIFAHEDWLAETRASLDFHNFTIDADPPEFNGTVRECFGSICRVKSARKI
jgi:hypothetical protein